MKKRLIGISFLAFIFASLLALAIVSAQENLEEVPEGSFPNLCTKDSDCENYCESRKPLFRGNYDCIVKSCTSKCVKNEYDPSIRRCLAEFEYYIEDYDKEAMIQVAKDFIISKVGEDYFDEHFEFFNITTVDIGANILFSHKATIPNEKTNPTYFPNNDITLHHCKGRDYTVSFVSSILEPLDIKIDKKEAINIAKDEGFSGQLDVNISSGTIEKINDEPSVHLNRPLWVLSKQEGVDCDDYKTIHIDMFEGNYIEKLYDETCYLESRKGERKRETSIPNYIYYVILVIAIFIVIILFLKLRKK